MYIVAPPLREVFRDKDSGLPLAAGVIKYFQQSDHITFKPIYAISGTPDDPIFTPLPNPYTLNESGTTNEAIYLYPFDADGNLQLYYVEVYSAGGILQFTQDLWPPDICENASDTIILPVENYFSNPQFRMHIDVDNGTLITFPLTNLAPGGWQFQVDEGFTSTNYVQFGGFTETIDNPPGNPPFFVEILCTAPGPSEIYKDLQKVMIDVNFLAGQEITFQFCGQTDPFALVLVELIIKRNYGPLGSTPNEETITFFTINSSIGNFNHTFTLNDNIGKTIDPDVNKTSIAFALRLPRGLITHTRLTNFLLLPGEFSSIVTFPSLSKEQDFALTMAGSIVNPNPDASDIGKYLFLEGSENAANTTSLIQLAWQTPTGVYADNIIIGGNFSTNPWQRGTGIDIMQGDRNVYQADRFSVFTPNDGNLNMNYARGSNSPPFNVSGVYSQNSIHVTSLNGSAGSPTDTAAVLYTVEGFDYQKIAQQSSILTFCVYCKAGRYSVFISNSTGDRTITIPYVIDATEVWQRISLVIPTPPSSGGWDYGTGIGLVLSWELSPPPNPVAPDQEGIWQNSDDLWGVADQVNLFEASGGNAFYIDCVDLRPGTIALPYTEPVFETMIAQCQRYYEKSYPLAIRPGTSVTSGNSGVGAYANLVATPDRMRMVCYYKATKRILGDSSNTFVWAFDGTRGQATQGSGLVTPNATVIVGESTVSFGEFTAGSTIFGHFTTDVEYYY
jgi:hypothetical protein